MPRSNRTDAATLRQVAKWYYKDHLTKTEIAKNLKFQNPSDQRPVNKMLDEAEKLKLVRIDIPETFMDCGPANDLRERFPHLKEIITVPWYGEEEYSDLLRRWGVAAAVCFEGLADQEGRLNIGITGGESLFEFCEAVSTVRRENIHVYTTSLVGRGRLLPTASHIDPIVNAALLWAKCGRIDGHIHYATVPPYGAMTREEIKAELLELSKREPIREAIEDMNKIDVAFAGLGPVKPEFGPGEEDITSKLNMTGLLQPTVTPGQLLKEGVIADISNSFFDATGQGDPEKWPFFLTAGHYDPQRRGVEFFRRMVQDGKTVILIAGQHKVEGLKVALKARLFNVWITDYQTLCEIAGRKPIPPKAKSKA